MLNNNSVQLTEVTRINGHLIGITQNNVVFGLNIEEYPLEFLYNYNFEENSLRENFIRSRAPSPSSISTITNFDSVENPLGFLNNYFEPIENSFGSVSESFYSTSEEGQEYIFPLTLSSEPLINREHTIRRVESFSSISTTDLPIFEPNLEPGIAGLRYQQQNFGNLTDFTEQITYRVEKRKQFPSKRLLEVDPINNRLLSGDDCFCQCKQSRNIICICPTDSCCDCPIIIKEIYSPYGNLINATQAYDEYDSNY